MKKEAVLIVVFSIFIQQNTLLHAAPPIEACPHDSVLVEDTCKCNLESCSKPPCLSELKISVNATDIPGECCPIYTCEGCTNDTLIEGKCPCAPGATLNSLGECKCVDPYKTLINNECTCDSDLCPLPEICDANYVSVQVKEDCCTKTKCIKCPDDSYPTNYEDHTVEDKCVCYPCVQECPPGEVAVVMQKGSGFPGRCCDYYKCESDKKCHVKDVVYSEGENWNTIDGQVCTCQKGLFFCSKLSEEVTRSCHSDGIFYEHNESKLTDECTNCTCFNGTVTCVSHMCKVPPQTTKKEECPPFKCNKECPEGYKLNKRGCKTCRCHNSSYKYDDLLHKYNITRNELKDILDDYFAHGKDENKSEISTTSTTTTNRPVTNISVKNEIITYPSEDTYSWQIILGLVGAPLILLSIFIAVWCRHQGKRGSYDTNPASSPFLERVKAKKDALLDNYIGK